MVLNYGGNSVCREVLTRKLLRDIFSGDGNDKEIARSR